jgi:hypothetical protein
MQADPPSGPAGRRARLDRAAAAYEKQSRPFLILVFVMVVAMPAYFYAGGIYLTFLRLFLLVMLLPLVFRWLSGRYGGIILPDILLLAHLGWTFIGLTALHGFARSVEFSAILSVETFGAWLLARTYIRDRTAFVYFVRCVLGLILFLSPFALYESLTRTMLISRVFDALPGISVLRNVNYEPRFGLFRAQATFEHPILYGTFCASAFALAWCVLAAGGAGPLRRLFWVGTTMFATVLSVSSGALVAIFVQAGLLGWDLVTRRVHRRWLVLTILFVIWYVTIDALSNRTPVTILISVATFNSGTAWNRVLIWEYGSAEVWRHPLIGIGFNDWLRPAWMGESVDNFWLVIAMRGGIPAFLSLAGAYLITMWRVGRMAFSADPRLALCQRGYLVALVGIFVALCTVHVWGGTYVYLAALVGSGAWMFTSGLHAGTGTGPDPQSGLRAGARPGQRSRST